MKKLVFFLGLWLLFAPAPPGIALNHETRECTAYWAGDEYMKCVLPSGWQDFYPRNGIIETEAGSCHYADSSGPANAESCCQELGYTYVEAPVCKSSYTLLGWYRLGASLIPTMLVVCLGLGLFLTLAITIWLLRQRDD